MRVGTATTSRRPTTCVFMSTRYSMTLTNWRRLLVTLLLIRHCLAPRIIRVTNVVIARQFSFSRRHAERKWVLASSYQHSVSFNVTIIRVPTPGKFWNFFVKFSVPGKSWNLLRCRCNDVDAKIFMSAHL